MEAVHPRGYDTSSCQENHYWREYWFVAGETSVSADQLYDILHSTNDDCRPEAVHRTVVSH